jgi:Integrase core domain
LYVAIDRTSKFAFVQLVKKTGRTSASAFLTALIKAVPYKIHTVLTDNGVQFTFPPRYADGPTARYMTHMFDMRCRENGIEHRLTKIKHPWTNGQVERMNRTIKEATVKRYHYDSHRQLQSHLTGLHQRLQLRQASQNTQRPTNSLPKRGQKSQNDSDKSDQSNAGTKQSCGLIALFCGRIPALSPTPGQNSQGRQMRKGKRKPASLGEAGLWFRVAVRPEAKRVRRERSRCGWHRRCRRS